MKLSIIGIFLLKEILSTRATDFPSKYDITKTLNESIIETLQSVDSNKIAESLLSYKIEQEHKKYETKNIKKLYPFGDTLYFDDLEIKILDCLELNMQIRRDFLANKLRIFTDGPIIRMTGSLNMKSNETYISFRTSFQYRNVSIVATPVPTNRFNQGIQIEFFYDYSSNIYFNVRRGYEKIPYVEKFQLQNIIDPIAQSLISNHFNNNKQFLHILSTTFSHQPKQNIISAYPDFLQDYDQRHYYYLIPTIFYSGLTLNQIILRGLSNFEFLKIKETIDHSLYTLLVKKIRGGLNLDHGIEQKKPIELDFTIDGIFITVDRETKRIRVDAQNYLFNLANSKSSRPSWLAKFANVLIHVVEKGIAASIMPSMKVLSANELSDDHDVETSIKQMLSEIAQTQTIDDSAQCSNKTNPYNYQISFKDMAIKITSSTPFCTKPTQCEFLKNLQIDHKINAIPIRYITTKPDTPISINFRGNFTTIKLAVINPNNTQTNNTCEFQITNDNDIEVKLLPTDDTIKKKIDASLLSMIKERITHNVIPLICYPIDVCDEAMKIVDDYFRYFIDNVLKKCSFRRSTTVT